MMTVLTLHGTIIKPRPECSHCSCEKGLSAPAASLCSSQLSNQRFKAGLFMSNNANKTEVCTNLFAETSKTKKCPGIQTSRQDGQCRQCDLSILQGELEISWLLLPLLSSSLTSSIALPRHFQSLCSSLCTDTVRKKAMMLGNLFTALLQESELAKNFDTSEIHPTVQWK